MLRASKDHWRAYLMEAAGLMAFMLSAGLFTAMFLYPGSAVSQVLPSDFARHAGIGLAMGLVTFAIVASIGKKSGAHINPAVTWSFYRLGKISGWDAIFYTLFQFIGAILAPQLLLVALGAPFAHERVKFATSMPGPDGAGIAFAAEFTMSYILMLTMLIAHSSKRLAKSIPAIVGLLIAVYITFESPLSGMSVNPARSFGSALTADMWDGLWVYFAAPVLAMLLAAETYRLLLQSGQRWIAADYKRGPDFPVAE